MNLQNGIILVFSEQVVNYKHHLHMLLYLFVDTGYNSFVEIFS